MVRDDPQHWQPGQPYIHVQLFFNVFFSALGTEHKSYQALGFTDFWRWHSECAQARPFLCKQGALFLRLELHSVSSGKTFHNLSTKNWKLDSFDFRIWIW